MRGHSHVDYTLRACRVEANDNQFLFDLKNSNDLIGMVMRKDTRGHSEPYQSKKCDLQPIKMN